MKSSALEWIESTKTIWAVLLLQIELLVGLSLIMALSKKLNPSEIRSDKNLFIIYTGRKKKGINSLFSFNNSNLVIV